MAWVVMRKRSFCRISFAIFSKKRPRERYPKSISRPEANFYRGVLRYAALRALRALPPLRPPLREAERFTFLPRPEPDFFPPLVSLFTVAQALRAASFADEPRFL